MTTRTFKAYDELLRLLGSNPSKADILGFTPSNATIERARYLIEGHRTGTLTVREAAEFDALSQLVLFKRAANLQAQK